MQKRENNYDLLRVISCLAIIFRHVYDVFEASFEIGDVCGGGWSELGKMRTAFCLLCDHLVDFGVPCFFMLAGAFALSNNRNRDGQYYYKKTWEKLGIPTLIFTLLYFGYSCVEQAVKIYLYGEPLSILGEPLIQLLKGQPYYHMWYMYTMIGLYALVPLLIELKERIGEDSFCRLSMIALVVCIVTGWQNEYYFNWGVKSFAYIGYFMAGYAIKYKLNQEKSFLRGSALISASLLLVVCMAVNHYYNGTISGNYNTVVALAPMVAIASVLLFAGISRLEIKKTFTRSAEMTFLIYLIHAFVLSILENLIYEHMERFFAIKYCLAVIPVTALVVFAVSWLLSIIYGKVFFRR